MAKANKPEQSNAMRGESQIENLPRDLTDEDLDTGTIAGQNLSGIGDTMAGENLDATAMRTTAATKTRAAQDRQTAATPTTMRGKKGNQPDANPPKR